MQPNFWKINSILLSGIVETTSDRIDQGSRRIDKLIMIENIGYELTSEPLQIKIFPG